MGILQYPQTLPSQVGVIGATKFMVTTDNLATTTAAGYLNNIDLAVYPISPSDVISCLYSFNQQTGLGTLGVFTVTISNGIITMVNWANQGNVLLPVVNGNFPVFNGTTGQIKDSSISASNPLKTKVASVNIGTVVDHIATYADGAGTVGINAATAINNGNIQAGISGTAGALISFPPTATSGSLRLVAVNNAGNFNGIISNASLGQSTTFSIPDPLAATAIFILDHGLNKMQPNSSLVLDHVTGTEAAGAITLNGQSGVITTSALTALAGTKYSITWTNSSIAISSVINLFWMGGTNNRGNIALSATAGNGTSTIEIFNNSPIDALNGTMLLGFTIF